MTANTDRVKSIAEAGTHAVVRTDWREGEKMLLASGQLSGFRCCYGLGEPVEGGIAIDSASADLLGLSEGDLVWSVQR